MSEKVIDLEEVLERVQEDKELLLELFDIFTKDYLQKTQTLKKAIAEKSIELIKDLVHSIKGAAGNISAKALHAVCVNIEELCAKKDIAATQAALPVLDESFKNLQGRIAEIKKEFGV